MSTSTLHLDLHPIAQNGAAIEAALTNIMTQAVEKRVRRIEIITGKGSGQLMKRVKRFLQQPHIKIRYNRIDVDAKNHGRLFVYL